MTISISNPIRLASRGSQLALAQSQEVADLLDHATVEGFSTRGDEMLDRRLGAIGGKGLFVKALEHAMLCGKADAAVHSAKDMEIRYAEGTTIAAFLQRADRRDGLVGAYSSFDELPQGAVVGTASVRRTAMIKAIRPDVVIKLLRGNINRRLAQLDEGHYDAIVLAVAGMERLGLGGRIHPIDEEVMLPAAAQGVIAIQTLMPDGDSRRRDVLSCLAVLNHKETALEVAAERAFLGGLDGSCETPVGVSAHYRDGVLRLTACLFSPDGGRAFMAHDAASGDAAEALGADLAARLLADAAG